MNETERIPCHKCKAMILPSTAEITSGLCMTCYKRPAREAAEQHQKSQPSYFGGLGAGKGWLQTNFLVSPEELRHLLSHHNVKLYVTNSRVECSYSGTSLDKYISDYSEYFDFVFNGREFIRKINFMIPSPIYVSLFIDEEEIQTEEFVHKGEKFKTVLLDKPPIQLSPCMISWTGKSISTSSMNEQGYFGLNLQYPKVYFSSSDGFSTEICTQGSTYHKLYSDIEADLKSLCRTHRFVFEDSATRPKLLISDSCMENTNRHWFLRSKGISVI